MRTRTLLLALAFAVGLTSCEHTRPDVASLQGPVDFRTHIKPILESRCQPCHFSGGVMYERRPFDRPETIHALGTKLFTRITNENERQWIRAFLAQQSDPGKPRQ